MEVAGNDLRPAAFIPGVAAKDSDPEGSSELMKAGIQRSLLVIYCNGGNVIEDERFESGAEAAQSRRVAMLGTLDLHEDGIERSWLMICREG